MTPRKKSDPLGEAFASSGDGAGDIQQGAGEPGAMLVDIDAFVTTVGEGPDGQAAGTEDDVPVVTYDDDDRGSVTHTLIFPPTVNGIRLKTVTMRQPEQEDIDEFSSGDVAGHRGMICRLTGLHPAVFKRLKWRDAEVLHGFYRDMMPEFVTE